MQEYFSIHEVDDVRVYRYMPENSNGIVLKVIGGGRSTEIAIYGLEEKKAEAMLLALQGDDTAVWSGGVHMKVDEYMETKDVYRALGQSKQEDMPF